MPKIIHIGDILELKKKHPCGGFSWEVLRVGADFKIKCNQCGCVVMCPRERLEKSIKKIIAKESSNNDLASI